MDVPGFPSSISRRRWRSTGSPGQPPDAGAGTWNVTVVGAGADAPVVSALCDGLTVPHCLAWPAAARIRDPGRAIVAFPERFDAHTQAALVAWADHSWQPLTILSPSASPSPEARAWLDARGFTTVHTYPRDADGTQRLRNDLAVLLAADTWLVPKVAEVLGCHDPAVVRALVVCVCLLPHRHTVTSWSRALGLENRQALHGLFAESGLPPPKHILDHVRLACIAHHGRCDRPPPDRSALAERFGYSSGDYLGKVVKRRLGCSLGQLIAAGPRRALTGLEHGKPARAPTDSPSQTTESPL